MGLLLWEKTAANGGKVLSDADYVASDAVLVGGAALQGRPLRTARVVELHFTWDGVTSWLVRIRRTPVTRADFQANGTLAANAGSDAAMGAVIAHAVADTDDDPGQAQLVHTYAVNTVLDDVLRFEDSDATANLTVEVKVGGGVIGDDSAVRAYVRS